MTSSEEIAHVSDSAIPDFVRDPLAVPAATLAARRGSMAERLELALSWNYVAAELRAGMKAATSRANGSR